MHRFFIVLNACFIFCLMEACKSDEVLMDSQFKLIPADQSNISFINQINEDELFNHLVWESIFNGSGVAVGDINNDKLPDLYFTGNQVSDALYLNKGNMVFEDISQSAGIITDGWSGGASMADVNGDGFLDIYVCKLWAETDQLNRSKRANKLFINNGDLTFTEVAGSYGLNDTGNSTNAAFLDYDLDGDLDIYLLNAPSNNYGQKLGYIKNNAIPYEFSDKLFRNDGNHFTDVTLASGVEDYGFGLGIVCSDLNNDGWVDIYVANDFEIADRMFINQKDGTFIDEVQRKLKHISYSSMGTDAADLTNDGLAEIVVLDMQAADHFRSKTNMPSMDIKQFWTNVARGQHYQYMSNMLQWNRGFGYFSEVAQIAGIASTDWSWSVLLADFDNDQFKDIFITNGINRDIRNNDFATLLSQNRQNPDFNLLAFAKKIPGQAMSNYMFRNNEHSLNFRNITKEWGLDQLSFSFGAAYADLDRDGDLDLIVCNNNDYPFLYENQNLDHNHFVGFKVIGNKRNKQAYGATLELFSKGNMQSLEISPVRGYQSAVEPLALFGLGQNTSIDSLLVVYENEKYVFPFTDSSIDRYYSIDLDSLNIHKSKTSEPKSFLREVELELNIQFRHTENRFDDFKDGRLMPHMESRNGPPLAYGDLNGDKLFDFIVGAAHNQSPVMFIQQKDGTFIKRTMPANPAKENMDFSIFDADNDGDQDIYIVNGGTEFPYDDPIYQDELLINNGDGTFLSTPGNIPLFNYNGSAVLAIDFDKDGDKDIIVGGHSYPGKYPFAGRSAILENNKGVFKLVSEKIAPEFMNIGLVTDMDSLDINQDGNVDFIAVGEWMAPSLFINEDGVFHLDTSYFDSEALLGWWFSVCVTDSEESGKYEIFLGNIGINNKYHPSMDKPLHIFASDMNHDSRHDIVLAKSASDMLIPVRGKECSTGQIPEVSEKFNKYANYAEASLEDIYGQSALKGALHLRATNFRTGVLTTAAKHYSFRELPDEVQIAPVMSFVLMDVNNDQKNEVIITGNHYDAEVETTKHDAGNGLVLLQDEDKNYLPLSIEQSGFYTPGNAKDMIAFPYRKNNLIIVSNNGFIVQAFMKSE